MRRCLFGLSKALFFICLVTLMKSVKGATYYFSSSSGDDSRTAAQARNPSTPWKTLNKLNSFFSNLKPGDSVLLKRGDKFFGAITISQSGTASAPIVLGVYGNGDKPIITGLVTLNNWTSLGNGIFESAANSLFNSKVNMVIINGNVKPMGRFPNANAANGGYITYQSHTGQTSITAKDLSSWPNWTGGEAVIRPIRHVLDRCLITNHSGSTITYNKASNYVPIDGYGFFIQNHIKTLDRFSEWYYNPKTKKLDVYFGAAKPLSYTIQATAQDVFITAQSKSYITIDNIMFKGANVSAIDLLGGSNITISNCDILYCGVNGVFTQGTSFVKVTNTTVDWCNSDGIYLQAPMSSRMNNAVTHCKVKHIGVFAGMGDSNSSSYQGITVIGGKNYVAYNAVDSTGYVGIKFLGGDSNLIKNNYVNHYCFIKNDGGGIYTWNNVRDSKGNLTAKTYYGNRIIGNIVVNAGVCDEGTIYSETNIDHPTYGSHGIYCDENTQNMLISGNTVANNGKGIFLHDNRNMTIENNTVFNNRERQMDVYYDDLSMPTVRGIIIKNNIFVSKDITQETAGFRSLYNDLESFGTYDNNYYAQTINKGNSIYAKYVKNDLEFYQRFNLPGWKLAYTDDQHSKTEAASLSQFTLSGSSGSNMYDNGTYDSKTTGTICYNTGGTCISSWVSGKLDGGCYKLSYKGTSTKGTTTNVVIDIGSVSSNKNYVLKYSMLGTKKNGTVGVYLRQGTSPYDQLTPVQYFPLTTTRSDNEVLFSSPVTENDAKLVFQFNDRDSTAYLDNVKIFASDVIITNPDDYVRFYYNPANTTKTIALDANYIDVKNVLYSGNITLAPYTSIILMKKSATTLVNNSLVSDSSVSNVSTIKEDSTGSNQTQLKLLAFPNPAPTEFNLLIQQGYADKETQIDVFDMSGRNVYHTTGDIYKKYTFGRDFLPGVYILRVTQGRNTQTIKLIK